jgi:asparagine synthase (glutamine-hydrolysing)
MCGIAGFLHFDNGRDADINKLKEITDCLIHRGPDGAGYFAENEIALGHRRLSIIDLNTGDQPMKYHDKNYIIVFNGEIYNYVELKYELEQDGYIFKTNSDTEVILAAYKKWGIDCQNKFNGMWAFALWDNENKKLFLSRDRMGEKPLFYAIHDNSIIFSSEIKSLLKYGVPQKPNTDLLQLYFSFGYIPEPNSFYKNIFKLPAANCLIVHKGEIKINEYWKFNQIDELPLISDRKFVHDEFLSLLKDSVRIRMRSDVPFGAFLSGGLDSSTIVALMSDVSKNPISTFTIGFKERQFDERELANDVALMYKTNHHEHLVEPATFEESLEKVMFHFDEPFGDSSAIPTGYVSRHAVSKVKMVLTGDGGDEVLSGYKPYQGEKFASQYQRIPNFIRKPLPGVIGFFSNYFKGNLRYEMNRAVKVLTNSSLPFNERFVKKLWLSQEVANQLTMDKTLITTSDYVNQFFNSFGMSRDPFYQLMRWHFKMDLQNDYLTKVDRMSMAYSLETRLPFLDFRLLELMIRVDKHIKMEGYTRKSVLRHTMKSKLPKSILNAPKKGFGVPLREWFKGDDFNERLKQLYTKDIGLNKNLIKKLVEDNVSGRYDYGNIIWMMLVYKAWIEKY